MYKEIDISYHVKNFGEGNENCGTFLPVRQENYNYLLLCLHNKLQLWIRKLVPYH